MPLYELFFGQSAAWFALPALIGTAIFLLRVVLMLVGVGHDGDTDMASHMDADVTASADAAHAGHHHDAGDGGFKYISVQSVFAFVMGFGWAGLAVYRNTDWGFAASAGCGIVGGIVMAGLLIVLLQQMLRLNASGNISISASQGREGDVYAAVPAKGGGRGQVRMIINDNMRIYNAVTDDAEVIASGTRVRVVRTNQDNTLTVTKA